MTTSDERTRAMVWAGAFLVELARSPELPLAVRQRAVWIARHFPTVEDVRMMAVFRYEPTGLGLGLDLPESVSEMLKPFPRGALYRSTRLEWPAC